jgi:hypothetical protein
VKSAKRPVRFILAIPLTILAGLLGSDLLQTTRASPLSAVRCTPLLAREEPDAYGLVTRYRGEIAIEAARYDLPPELLAASIVNHQLYIPRLRRFTDCFGSALGADLSLGLAQVRLSTAAKLDGEPLEDLSASEYRNLRSRLLDPEQNIAYQARELRDLLEQENRFPGIDAGTLIHNPFAMALLITEYRMGRSGTPSESSRLTASAFGALRRIHDGRVNVFDRSQADMAAVQTEIRAYLQYINCESGIFNASACESWQRSLTAELSPRRP